MIVILFEIDPFTAIRSNFFPRGQFKRSPIFQREMFRPRLSRQCELRKRMRLVIRQDKIANSFFARFFARRAISQRQAIVREMTRAPGE